MDQRVTLPDHLGGHCGVTNEDAGVLDLLAAAFAPRSFLDIGCGPGGMLRVAAARGMAARGIDGDFTLDFSGLDVVVHDFTTGPAPLGGEFDLGWCVEVLEHVEAGRLENLRPAFRACRRLWITHALPRQDGHHHVNCQPPAYWRKVFAGWGFSVDERVTSAARTASTMQGPYSRRTGLLIERNA